MVLGYPIETLLRARHFQFLDHTPLRENFKITVNGPKAYARQAFSYYFIDFVRGRMTLKPAKLFHDDTALLCGSLLSLGRQKDQLPW
jgi:hypothetical protein